tara:strand:- start:27 stop:290 length:264 start_codon:yes stop_codon:yes gene_type:complete
MALGAIGEVVPSLVIVYATSLYNALVPIISLSDEVVPLANINVGLTELELDGDGVGVGPGVLELGVGVGGIVLGEGVGVTPPDAPAA